MPRGRNTKAPGKTVEDLELWSRVKQTVTPLDPDPPDPAPPAARQTGPNSGMTTSATHSTAKPPKSPIAKPRARPEPVSTPPLTGLDRRTSQRLARGQIDAEARIDLHGESVETARVRLREFLRQSRARGLRTVLVITGKGSSDLARHTLHGTTHFHSPERQGRLRRSATQWFHEPEFTDLISGYQPAHPKHGGGGAFYVRLRRRDAPRRP